MESPGVIEKISSGILFLGFSLSGICRGKITNLEITAPKLQEFFQKTYDISVIGLVFFWNILRSLWLIDSLNLKPLSFRHSSRISSATYCTVPEKRSKKVEGNGGNRFHALWDFGCVTKWKRHHKKYKIPPSSLAKYWLQ